MIATTHLVVGAAVGSTVANPFLALIGGIISHHLLDALPHIDYGKFDHTESSFIKKWFNIAIDLSAAVILLILFYLTPDHQPSMIWGIVGALLPDIIHNNPLWSKRINSWPVIKQYFWFHNKCHWEMPNKLPYQFVNIIIQGSLIILALQYIPY